MQRPTNSKSCARLLLKHLYEVVGETGRQITPLQYSQLASQIGLGSSEMASALKDLRQDLLIAYPNQGMEIITLTKAGIERADYLRFRQEFPLVGDPLPDSLDGIQAEIRFWVQERPKHSPRSDEWRLIAARIEDLKHLENTMPRTPSSSSGFIPPATSALAAAPGEDGFLNLLHPAILNSSYALFRNGHLRDAVLNSVLAVFDLIRQRTGLDLDGTALVGKAFSLDHPCLIFSELDTESGQNDQKGFIQLLNGSYQAIRNTKAHSLNHDLDEIKAAQYLVHASLLARRVSEAHVPNIEAESSC